MRLDKLEEELGKFSDTRWFTSKHNLAKNYLLTTGMSTAIQVQPVTTCFHNLVLTVLQ